MIKIIFRKWNHLSGNWNPVEFVTKSTLEEAVDFVNKKMYLNASFNFLGYEKIEDEENKKYCNQIYVSCSVCSKAIREGEDCHGKKILLCKICREETRNGQDICNPCYDDECEKSNKRIADSRKKVYY